MNRRRFLAAAAAATTLAGGQGILHANEPTKPEAKGLTTGKYKLTPPGRGSIPVAMLISENLNVIDFSGPWGVFESVSLPHAMESPFRLFTVSEKSEVVVSGS